MATLAWSFLYHQQKVTEKYKKSFNFYKQHWVNHIVDDIRNKGTTDNYVARPGEGFHQEVKEAWDQTNCKDTDQQVRIFFPLWRCLQMHPMYPQMTRIDENHEVIALIRMAVDANTQTKPDADDSNNRDDTTTTPLSSAAHWDLGSPTGVSNSRSFENGMIAANKLFEHFHAHLVEFLLKNLPDEVIPEGFAIKVLLFCNSFYLALTASEDYSPPNFLHQVSVPWRLDRVAGYS
jgi:hypothetical protein